MTEKQKIELLVKKLVQKRIRSFDDFLKLKQKICSGLKTSMPGNVNILKTYYRLKKKRKVKNNVFFEKQLKKRPVRSLSGVAIIAVLTKPWPCPGKCIYCPFEKGVPKSYLSGEPAVERAKLLKYNPYQQVKKRIEVLEKNGHPTDKIELIVIGGTWSYLPKQYQTRFIKRCFDGANNSTSKNLQTAQVKNEKAKHRIIGLTLETRPDYISPQEILRMRKLGCTRVEIGVQITDDQILKLNNRGHGVKEIIQATKLLKNAGFKICYHMMPGLLGSNPQKDLKMFKQLFTNPDFQPDMLKIYPCVVTRGSKLYKLFKDKKYHPYSDKQLINLLVKIKLIIPPYVRINRLIRDIPAWQIKGGSKISNLREIVQEQMKKQKKTCQCIRCREIKSSKFKLQALKLIRQDYDASEGKEIFLSFEDIKESKLAAFLRLRLPNFSPDQVEPGQALSALKNAAIIRELHTYGQLVEIGKKPAPSDVKSGVLWLNKKAVQPRKALINQGNVAQHLGLGKKLMQQSEKIAKKAGYKKMAIISGLGVRDYYRHLGYYLQDTYMVKKIN
ncbi:tRNA uridine(34) 5-carboxymethylaminomethyl modification radical SAM/GNAT enzyme Elp3 [Patescibacteria group bacterium]|nr:tRNA uridine(34) 5-carboxymethylaminomethyl modification radical SAM/GNAT enzyme Elp3 [Patescibacteria group bacterium]